MNTERKIVLGLLVVVMAVVATAGPLAGSAVALNESNITVDSTANSEGDLAGDGNDALMDFNGSSSVTEVFAIRVNTSTDAGSLDELTTNFTLTDSESTTISHHSDEQTSDFLGSGEAWIDADHEGAHLNFTWADLETVPMAINENVTIEVEITASTDDSSDSDASTTFDLVINNSDERSVMYLEDGTTDHEDTVDVTEREPRVWEVFTDSKPDFHEIEDDRAVEAGNTSVWVYMEESDMQDDYVDRATVTSDGDIVWTFTAWDDGESELVPVFLNEFDDDVLTELDEDDDTYMIYHEDDDEIEVVVGDDYDEDELELVAGNHHPGHLDEVGLSETRELYGNGATAISSAFGFGVLGFTSAIIPFLIGRKLRNKHGRTGTADVEE